MDEDMLTSKTYHMICTPSRCIELSNEIIAAREKLLRRRPDLHCYLSKRPAIVWEPMEDSCHPVAIDDFLRALEHVDVFSPNQRELLALCGLEATSESDLDVQKVRNACAKLLVGTSQRAIVARCGAHGCLVVEKNRPKGLRVPAYHEPSRDSDDSAVLKSPDLVVDVTGESFHIQTIDLCRRISVTIALLKLLTHRENDPIEKALTLNPR